MRAQPGADHTELSAIEAHITQGVSLPLLTPPSSTSYVNTPSVAEHADAVRARLREYEQFGAVVGLPADTSTTDSDLRIQPLQRSIIMSFASITAAGYAQCDTCSILHAHASTWYCSSACFSSTSSACSTSWSFNFCSSSSSLSSASSSSSCSSS